MKGTLVLILLIVGLTTHAQSKKEKVLVEKVEALNKAIFFNKDSVALEQLLAANVSYGHSGGKVENRKEMINGAVGNKSTYSDQSTSDISVVLHKRTAVVRHVFSAMEIKDGTPTLLKLSVMQVWVKEKGDWRLMGRQSVKI